MELFTGFLDLVVPGVRPADASANDQARVATPSEVIRAAADYLAITDYSRSRSRLADPSISSEIASLEVGSKYLRSGNLLSERSLSTVKSLRGTFT